MTKVSQEDSAGFFAAVEAASKKAIWAAVATVADGEPRVRMVHPTWEGQTLWFATDKNAPKSVQMAANPVIDIQYQVSEPDFVHILVRGTVELFDDAESRAHCWEVMDYDLAEFWPDGMNSPEFLAVKITPVRVELSQMFGTVNKEVWRA